MTGNRADRVLRVIHVGIGKAGSSWYRQVLRPEPDVDVVAWVDVNPDALARLQNAEGASPERCFTNVQDAITSVQADCMVISASLPAHAPAARAALEAGLHVLMEKPFAGSVGEAEQLVAFAAERKRILMISQNYRFFPAPVYVRGLVQAKSLGELGVVHVDFRRNLVRSTEDRLWHFALPDPLLVDMSIHHFDLMRMVLDDEATRVRCSTWNPPYSHYRDPPGAELTVKMNGGALVTYRGSWCSTGEATPWAGIWHMEFENGEVVWTSRADDSGKKDLVSVRPFGPISAGHRAKRVRLPAVAAADRSGSLRAFIRAVRTGDEPETSGRRNIGSIALTYAARDAAASGGWVEIAR